MTFINYKHWPMEAQEQRKLNKIPEYNFLNIPLPHTRFVVHSEEKNINMYLENVSGLRLPTYRVAGAPEGTRLCSDQYQEIANQQLVHIT